MLSPEQRAAFEGKFGEQFQDTTTEPAAESAAPSTTPSEPDNKVEVKERHIPYTRFQEVNRAKRAAEERAQRLEAELQELRKPGRSEPKSFLDSLVEQEENPEPNPFEARLTAVEREYAAAKLDSIVAKTQRDYPDLPEDILLAAIGAGKSPEDAVEMWDSLKQRILGTQAKPTKAPPATPPTPHRTAPTSNASKPKTLDEAHVAFRKYLQALPR